jgi:signal transduction histidine kinase
VITNLLSNAAKFSTPGSDVLIHVRPGLTTLRIEVTDFGPGIPAEFQHRIFEKFAQANASATRRHEGTGLGLSIARKLIEAMGGTIGFSSVVGQGTTFYLELSRADTAGTC